MKTKRAGVVILFLHTFSCIKKVISKTALLVFYCCKDLMQYFVFAMSFVINGSRKWTKSHCFALNQMKKVYNVYDRKTTVPGKMMATVDCQHFYNRKRFFFSPSAGKTKRIQQCNF